MKGATSARIGDRPRDGRERTVLRWLVCVGIGLGLLVPTSLTAQEVCPDGLPPRPWIGVHALHCPGGSCARVYRLEEGAAAPLYDLSTEPWLRGVDGAGPAAGKLHEGDVLVAVNGYLIATRRGGVELARLQPGQEVELTVRRGERLLNVKLVPEARCEDYLLLSGQRVITVPALDVPPLPPLPAVAPSDPRAAAVPSGPPAAPTPEATVSAGGVSSRSGGHAGGARERAGRLGLALSCDDCSFRVDENRNFTWVRPGSLRVVAVVAGGAADAAGLRPGDLITEVNGQPVDNDAAGRALFAAPAGEVLRIVARRGEEIFDTTLVVGGSGFVGGTAPRPAAVAAPAAPPEVDRATRSALGTTRAALAKVARFYSRAETGTGTTLIVSGKLWGPAALGVLFEPCGDCPMSVTDEKITTRLVEPPVVASVFEEGPAARAGLRPGDVILRVDGLDVTSAAGTDRLLNAFHEGAAGGGTKLRVAYRRGDEERTAVISPGAR